MGSSSTVKLHGVTELLHFIEDIVLGFCLLGISDFILFPIVQSLFGVICYVIFQTYIIL